MDSGLFGFWRRFGSATGGSNLWPSPKPRQNQKSSLHIATSFYCQCSLAPVECAQYQFRKRKRWSPGLNCGGWSRVGPTHTIASAALLEV